MATSIASAAPMQSGASCPSCSPSSPCILSSLRSIARLNPSGIATVSHSSYHEPKFTTYRDLVSQVERLASALYHQFPSLGRAGERLALLCRNHDVGLTYIYAAAALGIVIVPLNVRWSNAELLGALQDSGSKVLISDNEFSNRLASISTAPDLEGLVIIHRDEATPPFPVPRNIRQVCLHQHLLNGRKDFTIPSRSFDLQSIIYTSGSTGPPKGVMLPHSSQIHQAQEKCATVGYNQLTVYLNAAPMFHVGGLTSALAVTMAGGTHIFLDKFDGPAAVKAIKHYKINTLVVVPAMLHAILQAVPERETLDSVTAVLVGGQSMSKELKRQVRDCLPRAHCIQTYACTEAGSSITFAVLDLSGTCEEPRQGKIVGYPGHRVKVRIIDEKGKNLGPNKVGQILTKGPHIMRGYWRRADATRKALHRGWLYTGDLGYLDENKCLYFMGRNADVIRSGGETIHASEVESVLEDHPLVQKAAVFGVEDKVLGEKAVAAVIIDPKATDGIIKGRSQVEEEIKNFCQERMARYKCPKQVVVLQSLPTTATGKVKKGQLKSFL